MLRNCGVPTPLSNADRLSISSTSRNATQHAPPSSVAATERASCTRSKFRSPPARSPHRNAPPPGAATLRAAPPPATPPLRAAPPPATPIRGGIRVVSELASRCTQPRKMPRVPERLPRRPFVWCWLLRFLLSLSEKRARANLGIFYSQNALVSPASCRSNLSVSPPYPLRQNPWFPSVGSVDPSA